MAALNASSHRLFLLSGFDDLGALRPLLFLPFFLLLLASMAANSLLLLVIVRQRSLHSPMYVLIGAMACVDLALPLLLVPPVLLNFLFGLRSISLSGCLLQMFCVHFLCAAQSTLLLCMALDRYFAICAPLRYHERTSARGFLRLVLPLLARNLLLVALVVLLAGNLSFCAGNAIAHCFCEHMALVELACGSTAANSALGLASLGLIPAADFFFIVLSYALIFGSALRSGSSGAKALHTCVTHIAVMSVSLSVVLGASLSYRVRSLLPQSARVLLSLAYVFVPSCFNPVIYGVRTAQIRRHVSAMLTFKSGGAAELA